MAGWGAPEGTNYLTQNPYQGGGGPPPMYPPPQQDQGAGEILGLVYYKDQKDAKDAASTAAAAFAALTFAATPTQTDVNAVRDKQAAVNTQVVKFMESSVNQSLITSLLRAQNQQNMTLAAILLVR